MLYSHQVERSGEFIGLRHFREQTTSKSGLVGLEEIARTVATISASREHRAVDGLITPNAWQVHEVTRTRAPQTAEPPELIDETQCEGIEDFVAQGVRRWDGLIGTVGGMITRIQLEIAGNYRVDPLQTNSGILVDGPPRVQFQSFAAQPEEIEALERIAFAANRIISLPATGTTGEGNYL